MYVSPYHLGLHSKPFEGSFQKKNKGSFQKKISGKACRKKICSAGARKASRRLRAPHRPADAPPPAHRPPLPPPAGNSNLKIQSLFRAQTSKYNFSLTVRQPASLPFSLEFVSGLDSIIDREGETHT
jgi:hypothetical protein